MKNIMKRNISKGLALGFAAGSLVLAACGGDNGSSSKEPGYDDDTVATFKDLPACDSKIEGWIYYVTDEDAEYACGNGKWDLFDDIWGDKSSSSSPVAGSSSEGQSSSSEVASSSSVLSSSSSSVVEYSSCEEAVSSSSVAAQSSSSGAVSPSSSSEAESSSSAVSSSSSEGVESSSSEVSETVVSCDMVMKINGMHTCGEMPANIPQAAEFKASCNVSAEEALFVTSTLGTGCPSGYVLKCSDAGGSLYSYNQEDKGKTCEQYLAEQEEDDDEESSSSVASSSSIVSSSSSVKGTSDID
ncbi:MAG: hypothetical protein HUK19_01155, partial [Fibrobacter sp.]|nr:hypothetical protein [Fibrobacter sp.]